MSMSSYRLETPRPRPPPPPIRTRNLKSLSPSDPKEITDSLFDGEPTAVHISRSRAASPPVITSPKSPSYSTRSRSRGATPPPSGHLRSTTPSQPIRSELEAFAENCRSWYFDQDDNAGRLMTHTLATLPPSQRAPFSRLQASIRSAYHASINARRNAEFKAHLSATHPGGSLMPHSRADPKGPLAKKERYDRLERFVRTWCTMGMPGTKPFFEGLWAVMRLQVIPEHLGGAGGHRIEWEIDDAVFKEAAGKDFMLEAIDVLKGVLAFEEALSNKRSPSLTSPTPYSAFSPLSTIHSRSQSQPLPADTSALTSSQKVPPITSSTQKQRPRAPSDPFLDSPGLSASFSSANTTAGLSTCGSTSTDEPLTPHTPLVTGNNLLASTSSNMEFSESDEYMRTWIAPDLPNPEFISLLSVFPTFITRSSLPRFPKTQGSRRLSDLEEGSLQDENKRLKVGTGTIWVGRQPRTDGWQGGWWIRFKLWLQRLLC